jgi:hypothetical protein
MHPGVVVLLILCVAPMLQACSWQVVSPDSVQEPATVYVSIYGRHTRLALPDGPGHYVEYGFGDWRFYAEAERNVLTGVQALFFSSGSTLSRRELAQPGASELHRHFSSNRTEAIEVPAIQARQLGESLQAAWNQAQGEQLNQGALAFRRTPIHYSLFHNSNHQTARWLEQLQCDVRGIPFWSDFRVLQAE